jgi:hypothetical protein
MTSSADLTYTATSGTLLLQDADRATFQLKGTQTSDTTAVAQIAVSNAGDSTASIAFFRDGAADAMSIRFGTQQVGSTSVDERMRIANDGVITFTDDNSTQTTIFSGVQTGSDGTVVDLSFRNGSDSTAQIGVLRSGADDACDMIFATQPAGGNVTERMRIDSTGQVGIGINPPTKQLHVSSGDEIGFKLQTSSSTGATISLESTGTGGTEWRIVSGANGAGIGGGNFGFYSMQYNGYVWTAGEDGVVGIGAFPGDGDVERLHVKGTGTAGSGDDPLVRLESTDTDEFAGPTLEMQRDVPGATDDLLGEVDFKGQKADGTAFWYSRIGTRITDATNGYGRIQLFAAGVGDSQDYTDINRAQLTVNAGDVTVNNSNRGNVDFIVKKGGSGRFIDCDASASVMGLSGAPTSGGADVQVKGTLESLEQSFSFSTATLALTDAQCRNSFVQLVYDTAAMAVTLPTAVTGMKVTLARMQVTNAPTIVAQSGEKINGVTSPSTISIGTQYQVVVLHGLTGTGWVAYEPAVAA